MQKDSIRCLELALEHSLDDFKEGSIIFIKIKGEEIIKSEQIMSRSEQNLKTILELSIWDGEKSLAAACIERAKQHYQLDSEDPKDQSKAMGELFDLIPFTTMDPLEITKLQKNYRGIFSANEFEKLVLDSAKAFISS